MFPRGKEEFPLKAAQVAPAALFHVPFPAGRHQRGRACGWLVTEKLQCGGVRSFPPGWVGPWLVVRFRLPLAVHREFFPPDERPRACLMSTARCDSGFCRRPMVSTLPAEYIQSRHQLPFVVALDPPLGERVEEQVAWPNERTPTGMLYVDLPYPG